MTTPTTSSAATSATSATARTAHSRLGRGDRSVEQMLEEISLVLWITRKMKAEILADAAPQRGRLLNDQTEPSLAGCA